MPRPAKTLRRRIADRTFLARRHGSLLAGPLTGPDRLRTIQRAYQDATSDPERRDLALQYERAMASLDAEQPAGAVDTSLPVAGFFSNLLTHVKGPAAGQPFVLEPWQAGFVEELERRDERDLRIFKRALLGIARGNGKSPLAAGLALRELVTATDEPDVILAAAARDQARVVFEYARGFVESGPLVNLLQVGRHEISNRANGGVLRTVSADGYVAHGINPSAVVIDELHAWRTDKQCELFDALDTAIHKRPDAFWLAISTAGHDTGSLLGKLHARLSKMSDEEREAAGLLFCWYGADAEANVDDEELWMQVNPASWITVRDLRRQRQSPSMSRTTFARLHLNAWVAPDAERWIPTEKWDALAERRPQGEGGRTLYIGADGSRSYDTTAVAWASPAPDGRIDVGARIFSVRPDVPHHVLHDGTIDFDDVENYLLELASEFDVAQVRFDPRYLERSMEVLSARLPASAVVQVEPFSKHHRAALAEFERAVLEGTLRHSGDPAVGAQVAAAGVDRFDNGDVRRIRKLDRSRPIDAAVALSLAVSGALNRVESGDYLPDVGALLAETAVHA